MPRRRPDAPRLVQRRGKWEIEWYDNGQRKRVSTGQTDLSRARQALTDFETQLERKPLKLDFSTALDRYSAAKKGKVMAHSRLEDAAGALRAGMGHLRVDQVNQTQWDIYAAARVTRKPRNAKPENHIPRPVSTGTMRREFNVMRAAVRQAWKDGFLVKPPTFEAPADSAPRDRYLTKIEARRLIDACETAHVRAFVSLALYTGARKGSILALTWDRVSFETGMIDFQEPGRKITGKRRSVVPMGASLRTELEAAHKMRQTEYVVEYGGKAVPFGLRWSFARLCTRAKLTWRPTPHHLKHSVASWFAMERVPIDQAADWLATDPKTLMRTYRKFDPTYLKTFAGALEF